VRVLLADFFLLFFSAVGGAFRFSTVEWLNKEVFPDPPKGSAANSNIVAKLRTREAVPEPFESWIPSSTSNRIGRCSAALRPRMPNYYHFLRRKHHCRLLPIGFYMRVRLEGHRRRCVPDKFWSQFFQIKAVGILASQGWFAEL